jgi:hypothetical protein
MTKQHNDQSCRAGSPNTPGLGALQRVKQDADGALEEIAQRTAAITDLKSEFESIVKALTHEYAAKIEAKEMLLKGSVDFLMRLMKKNKGILFDGTDVVNLSNGSLIHHVGDHVTIPKTALAACKENKFIDVIKIVESLDRDKIEKWPDAKLVLIGAERKKKEELKYSLKK